MSVAGLASSIGGIGSRRRDPEECSQERYDGLGSHRGVSSFTGIRAKLETRDCLPTRQTELLGASRSVADELSFHGLSFFLNRQL